MFFKRKSLKSLEMWRFGVRTGTFFRNASRFPGAGRGGRLPRQKKKRRPPGAASARDQNGLIRLSLLVPHLGEALAAVHGTVRLRLEGHAGFAAAGGADSGEILPGTAGRVLAGVTAGLAPLGLVLEAALGIELLLAGGEHELLAALLAN